MFSGLNVVSTAGATTIKALNPISKQVRFILGISGEVKGDLVNKFGSPSNRLVNYLAN